MTFRYLQQKDKAPSYHKAMAEYFLDMWNDIPKPYSGNEKGCLRYVCPQPLSRVNPYTLKTGIDYDVTASLIVNYYVYTTYIQCTVGGYLLVFSIL